MASRTKTAVSFTSVPVLIIAGAKCIEAISKHFDLGIDDSLSYQIITVVYGGFQGLIYWIKNRK
jgi:hypothetical protein